MPQATITDYQAQWMIVRARAKVAEAAIAYAKYHDDEALRRLGEAKHRLRELEKMFSKD